MHPVLFDDYIDDGQLVVLSEELGAYSYKRRLVGMTAAGFLYVDQRISKTGYYVFHPKLAPVAEVHQVTISRYFAWKGVLGGIFAILWGINIFLMWLGDELIGPGAIVGPLVLIPGGVALIVGAMRDKIAVHSARGTFAWISPVLQREQSRSTCRGAADYCRQAGIPCASHLDA